MPAQTSITATPPVSVITSRPAPLVERLRARAARNHRSMQGELLAIVEQAVMPERRLSIAEIGERVRALGNPSLTNDSVDIIRADRDSR